MTNHIQRESSVQTKRQHLYAALEGIAVKTTRDSGVFAVTGDGQWVLQPRIRSFFQQFLEKIFRQSATNPCEKYRELVQNIEEYLQIEYPREGTAFLQKFIPVLNLLGERYRESCLAKRVPIAPLPPRFIQLIHLERNQKGVRFHFVNRTSRPLALEIIGRSQQWFPAVHLHPQAEKAVQKETHYFQSLDSELVISCEQWQKFEAIRKGWVYQMTVTQTGEVQFQMVQTDPNHFTEACIRISNLSLASARISLEAYSSENGTAPMDTQSIEVAAETCKTHHVKKAFRWEERKEIKEKRTIAEIQNQPVLPPSPNAELKRLQLRTTFFQKYPLRLGCKVENIEVAVSRFFDTTIQTEAMEEVKSDFSPQKLAKGEVLEIGYYPALQVARGDGVVGERFIHLANHSSHPIILYLLVQGDSVHFEASLSFKAQREKTFSLDELKDRVAPRYSQSPDMLKMKLLEYNTISAIFWKPAFSS